MKKKLLLKRLYNITYVFIALTLLMVLLTPCFIYFNRKYKIVGTTNMKDNYYRNNLNNEESDIF